MNSQETASTPPWWQVATVGRNPTFTLIRLAVMAGLILFSFKYVFVPVRVAGISMLPAFKNGERHWVSPVLMWWRGLSRGDVVAVQTTGRHVMYLKRVLGLPGETVRIAKGEVLINGQAIDEPYIPRRAPWNWPTNGTERLLGADEFFVVGDNRTMRVDAHYFGVAERPRILGKLVR